MEWFSKYDAVTKYATDFLDNRGVGYECTLCGKVICCGGNGSWQGIGFMRIAMQQHMEAHYNKHEIPDVEACTRHID